MTPQKQLYRHDPPRSFGDCHRTAISCLLDIPLEHVPNWAELHWEANSFNRAVDTWLEEHFGLRQFHVVYSGDRPLEEALNSVEMINPGVLFLLCGTSKNGTAHTVVAGSGRILWDPSKDSSGIVGPADGFYWVTMLVCTKHFARYHHDEQAEISPGQWLENHDRLARGPSGQS